MSGNSAPSPTSTAAQFRSFVRHQIAPLADQIDRQQCVPEPLIQAVAQRGWLGSILPVSFGGAGLDMLTYGLLHEEIGYACSSIRSLLTVHDMVCYALLKYGSRWQKDTWLPPLARGQLIAAFALSEPEVGSDASHVQTTAEPSDGEYVLNGTKMWISFGQRADLLLVFARVQGKLSALLVEKTTPGLQVIPIKDMLGARGSMLAQLKFTDCRVPACNLVSRPGAGFIAVGATALDLGRYSVACGCVGLGQACLDACLDYAEHRQQFGKRLREHQLISRMLADMLTDVSASRALCRHAGRLKDAGDPEAVLATLIAKYHATEMVTRVTQDGVQLHGANGCTNRYPVERFFRDARVMPIIEGSSQILQTHLAGYAYRAAR